MKQISKFRIKVDLQEFMKLATALARLKTTQLKQYLNMLFVRNFTHIVSYEIFVQFLNMKFCTWMGKNFWWWTACSILCNKPPQNWILFYVTIEYNTPRNDIQFY